MNKWKESLAPLLNLLPALAVIALIAATLPLTRPVLEAIPERLTILTEAVEPDETAEIEVETLESDTALPTYADGVYTGSAQGYGGVITVQVTVENGKITEIEILDASGETDTFLSRAMSVIDRVLASQTWEVDVISGATYSSNGILGAIRNALTGEEAETEEAAEQPTATPLSSDAFTDAAAYADGVYTGSARGFGGQITVQVTVSGGVMTAIKIVSAPGETASYLARAEGVISAMLASGSPNVDVVSGATYSSTGIINAVKRALNKAAVDGTAAEEITEVDVTAETEAESGGESMTVQPSDITAQPAETYADGVYAGTGTGFGGDITVQVTVEDGLIVSITILSAEDETPSYLTRASGIISSILTAQSTDVDAISGATYSSKGIREAVQNALQQALTDGFEAEEANPGQEESENPEEEESGETEPDESVDEAVSTVYADGVYSAQALCTDEDMFSYWLQVDVTIQDGLITGVDIAKYDDDSDDPESNETYLNYAIYGRTYRDVWYEGIVSQVLALQSGDGVDVVSRATYSSNAIITGAQEALGQALTDGSEAEKADPGQEESEDPEEEESGETEPDESVDEAVPSGYANGVYSAQALCTDEDMFSYWLQVDVTIQDGLITGVDIAKYDDDSDDPESNETYLNYAIYGRTYRDVWYEGIVSQVLALQSGDGVDVVSRATYSSNAIISGVQEALAQASAAEDKEVLS